MGCRQLEAERNTRLDIERAGRVVAILPQEWLAADGPHDRPYSPSRSSAPTSMNEVWYSQEWDNAPMPHAIFFMKDGHAIHGSYEVKTLGKPVSHGCVRISPKNAATLYALVKKNGMKNTQVVLTGVTPGGESNVASDEYPGWFESEDNYYASPRLYRYAAPRRYYAPQRRGFFEQLFGD